MSSVVVSGAEHGEEIIRRIDSFRVPDVSNDSFLKAAISLKNQVVNNTWTVRRDGCIDPTAYTGLLGTALMCMRSYDAIGSLEDLRLCAEIVDMCTLVARNCKRHVTFLCGEAGVYALGAVVANYRDDPTCRDILLNFFFEVASDPTLPVGPEDGGFGMPYDLLHGRAGFLYAALFINKFLGEGTVPSEITDPIVRAILSGGRAGSSDNMDCPLMYRWHGTRDLGAAHGLAGILHVLLHFGLKEEDLNDVKETIKYMVRNRFRHGGNYPSSEGNKRDRLVQWSHGAGGTAIMLCKAAQVFSDDPEFRAAAIEAGEVVWNRGINSRIGLSDGISGNAYAFLSLYRLTKDEVYLERAKAFSEFLYHNAAKLIACSEMNSFTESGYSLFHGLSGVACLWLDLVDPENAKYPGFEV